MLDLGVVSVHEIVEAAPLGHVPQLEYNHLAAWLPWPFC